MAIVSNGFYCEAVCFSPVNFYSDCQNSFLPSFLSFFLFFFFGGGGGGLEIRQIRTFAEIVLQVLSNVCGDCQ